MLFKILSHVKVAFLVFAKIIEGFLVHLYVFFGAAHTKKFSVLVFAKIIEGFLVHLYVFFWRCTYEHIFRDQKLAWLALEQGSILGKEKIVNFVVYTAGLCK
jgi:hypothetical protein